MTVLFKFRSPYTISSFFRCLSLYFSVNKPNLNDSCINSLRKLPSIDSVVCSTTNPQVVTLQKELDDIVMKSHSRHGLGAFQQRAHLLRRVEISENEQAQVEFRRLARQEQEEAAAAQEEEEDIDDSSSSDDEGDGDF